MGRILGIDHGLKRIGLALSDPTNIISQPLPPLAHTSTAEDAERVIAAADEHGVDRIVVGVPLLLDGSVGKQSRSVRSFIRAIEERTEIEVIEWDERFTTRQAERRLAEAGVTRRKKKKAIDTMAAQLILQSYLDTRPGANDVYLDVDIEDLGPTPDRSRRDRGRDRRKSDEE